MLGYGLNLRKIQVITMKKRGICALGGAFIERLRYGYNICYARFRAAPGVRILA